MTLATQFIDPLFNSLFYMQWVTLWSCLMTRNSKKSYKMFLFFVFVSRLNIYYLILEKMNSFADEAKYDISNISAAQIAEEYEGKRTDAWSIIESMGIVKRIVSVCTFDSSVLYVFCLRPFSEAGPSIACSGSDQSNKFRAPRNHIFIFLDIQSKDTGTTFGVGI